MPRTNIIWLDTQNSAVINNPYDYENDPDPICQISHGVSAVVHCPHLHKNKKIQQHVNKQMHQPCQCMF